MIVCVHDELIYNSFITDAQNGQARTAQRSAFSMESASNTVHSKRRVPGALCGSTIDVIIDTVGPGLSVIARLSTKDTLIKQEKWVKK